MHSPWFLIPNASAIRQRNQGPAPDPLWPERSCSREVEIAVNGRRCCAYKGSDSNQIQPADALFGSWAPVPQMPGGGGRNVGQTKLWLWSKTPFEYTRRSEPAWDDWFTRRIQRVIRVRRSPRRAGTSRTSGSQSEDLPNPWHHPDEPGLIDPSEPGRRACRSRSWPNRHTGFITHSGSPETIEPTITLPRPY